MRLINFFWEIVNTNLISQILGGFFAAFIFWKFFEEKLKCILEFNKNKKDSKLFLEEILYNRIVITKVLEKQKEYIAGDKFTFLKYETKNLDNFLNLEPLNLKKNFYTELRILSAALKKDNMLIDIFWFSPHSTVDDRTNAKETYLSNAQINLTNIDNVISNNEFTFQMKKMGLTDQ